MKTAIPGTRPRHPPSERASGDTDGVAQRAACTLTSGSPGPTPNLLAQAPCPQQRLKVRGPLGKTLSPQQALTPLMSEPLVCYGMCFSHRRADGLLRASQLHRACLQVCTHLCGSALSPQA